MTAHELTRDQLIKIIGKMLAAGGKISDEQIAQDYQVSQDYSEQLAKILETPVTKISDQDIPPVTEPFPKSLEEGVKSALWEKGYKFAPATSKELNQTWGPTTPGIPDAARKAAGPRRAIIH
jgi:hypothetical protein